MPYMKVNEENKVKVYKKGPDGRPIGKLLGTHDDEAGANDQIATLMASEGEDKETKTKEEKCGPYDEGYSYVPWGVTSFDEVEAIEAARDIEKEVRKSTSYFSQLASNILGNMEVKDKATALARLATDYAARIGRTMATGGRSPSTGSGRSKETPATEKEAETAETPQSSLLIWKENDTYRWIAAYSNNFRDDDNPPEIISTQSHKEFDQALEKGEWPMPSLWLWHIPYPVGQATVHTFDEGTGFTLSAGEFFKDMDWAAEGVIKEGWTDVSHGMPSKEIRRDEKDKTIVTRHRTIEISFLPQGRGANKLAFNIISKENDDMAIPERKRDEFVKAFGLEKVEAMEKVLEGRAKEAQEAGIEQKEQDTSTGAATPAEKTPEQQALSPGQVADAIIMAVTPLAEAVKALTKEVKELKKSDAEKVAEKAAGTPVASLESLLSDQLTGLFSKETEIDGRTSLAKSKPKETKGKGEGGLFFQSWLQQ